MFVKVLKPLWELRQLFSIFIWWFFFGQQRGAQLTIWASDQIGNFTNNFFLLRYKIRMIIKMKTTEN